ncbi:MAG TPA: protein kinase [Thermoanaerobaculia bacterium]|jgi:serine/threonine protein kinase
MAMDGGPQGFGSGSTAGEGLTDPTGPTERERRAVPQYRILGVAGIGGMGVVYHAEDTRLGRPVALKFLPPVLTPNPRAKARFLNEARAAAALDHANICTIHEAGETAEGQLYLAMAYYEGETLKQRLERGPLPAAEALDIALQVARGLSKAHRQGIVHRDIKPANLMITVDGVVKILDFGIARLPDETLSNPVLGTPGYMSPEQARAGAVDARSDVWSLGVVLYEMLTGRLPERREEDLPAEPPGLDRVLSRMLAEEPADRYPDAAALLADLSTLVPAATGTGSLPVRAPGRRRPVRTLALGVALALAVTAGVVLLRSTVPHDRAETDLSQATLTRLTDLPGREWFPSLSPDGSLFVFARKLGDRSRLFLQQVGGGTALDLLPDSFAGDSQPAFSPDGRQIAFRSERDGGGIFVMGLMGESVRRVTDFGFNPAWSPDGREILCATEGIDNPLVRRHPSAVYRISLATGQRRLVSRGDAVQPSWSPHGFRIAYWGLSPSGERMIWTLPAAGGRPVQATAGKSIDWNPVWSPDGRFLYFASDRSGVINLWRMPIDERSGRTLGDPEPVNTSGQASMLVSLSRDGRHIVYASDETRTILEKVAFEPASGTVVGQPAAITQTSDRISAFDASRDGRWLVYQTSIPQEDLLLVHPDGTGWRRLTEDAFRDRQPRWSPDGTRIAFYSNRGGHYEIWLLRADGSQLERAAVIPGKPAYHPIWSPDGRWIACDLGENEALIDLSRPLADRRPLLLPLSGHGLGFSASSWSADGRWLAGALHQPDGRQLPGVVLYSLAGGKYMQLTDHGQSATWLSDSRRLLYSDGGKLFLLDTLSRASRQVLDVPPDSDYSDFCLSPDDRVLYLARDTEQGDIWLLTMR